MFLKQMLTPEKKLLIACEESCPLIRKASLQQNQTILHLVAFPVENTIKLQSNIKTILMDRSVPLVIAFNQVHSRRHMKISHSHQ